MLSLSPNPIQFRPQPSHGADAALHALHHAGLSHLTLRYEPTARTVWMTGHLAGGPARVTHALLRDLAAGQRLVAELHAAQVAGGVPPLLFMVVDSAIPGIYNLGGDIAFFAESIRNRDRAAMQSYAQACIDVVYRGHRAMELPITTISLVQGDALGGGFEGALQHDVLIAERSARLGLPEVLFNLFPGMGATSFLSRRLDQHRAHRLISEGVVHTGEALHAMGVVDVLAEDGAGEDAARSFIEEHGRRGQALAGIMRARRCVNPVTRQELENIIDVWVDTAMLLEEPDLRRMERLVAAQARRLRQIDGSRAPHAAE